eukprot:7092051-Pyramimonas_sp.AAC.1
MHTTPATRTEAKQTRQLAALMRLPLTVRLTCVFVYDGVAQHGGTTNDRAFAGVLCATNGKHAHTAPRCMNRPNAH